MLEGGQSSSRAVVLYSKSKPLVKRPRWRPRRRWKGNIRMNLKICVNTRNWIEPPGSISHGVSYLVNLIISILLNNFI